MFASVIKQRIEKFDGVELTPRILATEYFV